MRLGYARVSTQKTAQDISIEGQQEQLRAAGCSEVIVERASAYSGKHRPGWERLWGLVATGEVSEVMVVDQSRLSRSGDDLDFLEACALKGVKVITLTGGPIETETVGGFITAGVLSVMNRAQSKLIGAKVRDGIKRRRASGHYACSRVPFGYRVTDGKVEPDPDNWAAARQMFDELVAAEMNVTGWIKASGQRRSSTGIKRWLDHPMLRGAVLNTWGQVEPLITWQEWEQAKRLRQSRSCLKGRTAGSVRLLTGLVKCQGCDVNLHHAKDGKTMRLKCKSPFCRFYGKSIKADKAKADVVKELRQAATAMAELASLPLRQEPTEAIEIRARITQLQELAANGVPGLEAALTAQQEQLSTFALVPSGPRRSELATLFAEPGTLEGATDEELRAVIIEFVAAIQFSGSPVAVEVTLR